MNNKIRKGLSYLSVFILAFAVLPLGSILADEKVIPTKFVIEGTNLEGNGFKIANDQVLTLEDVVKLSNVKSVDNLVDVNNLIVSEDQLANINQINPDGGLYKLVLTDGQQATITIPVVKEGALTITNSKGALIFKNLALSQEAKTKEQVLEETGVYSVAFNNGYENKDLDVNFNDGNAIVRDNNLGLSYKLAQTSDIAPRSGEGNGAKSTLVLPNAQASIDQAAQNGDIAGAINMGKENLQATLDSAEVIKVTTEQQIYDGIWQATSDNVVIDVATDITVTQQQRTNAPREGMTITFTSTNGSKIIMGQGGSTGWIDPKKNNTTINVSNLTIEGYLAPGGAKQQIVPAGTKSSSDFIILWGESNVTVNIYPGTVLRNVYTTGDNISGSLLSTYGDVPGTVVNLFGGEVTNVRGWNAGITGAAWGGPSPDKSFTVNMFDFSFHDNYSSQGAHFMSWAGRQEYWNYYGGDLHDNYSSNGWYGLRGLTRNADTESTALTVFQQQTMTRVGGDLKVYNNSVVDAQFQPVSPANFNVNSVNFDNKARQTAQAQGQIFYNLTPSSNIHVGDGGALTNVNNLDNKWATLYDATYGGVPLGKIVYTNQQLQAQYQGNGIAEGLVSDWENANQTPQTLTKNGNYRIVEKEVNGTYYAVLVKEYTNLTINGIAQEDQHQLNTNNVTIPSRSESTIPAPKVEGYIVKSAQVKTNDGGGLQPGQELQPVYDQQKNIIGFTINPGNQENAASNMTVEIIYEKEIKTYIVKFEGNGSTSGHMDDQSIQVDQSVQLAANKFDRTGYTFSGWNTSEDGQGQSYAPDAMVENLANADETITLYAQWTPITYTVNFNGGNDTTGEMKPQSFTYDQEPTALTDNGFSKVGYNFAGWTTTPDAQNVVYQNGQKVQNLTTTNQDVVQLYAVWTPKEYKITFLANDATGSTKATNMPGVEIKTYGQDLVVQDPSREGYIFEGWSQDQAGPATINPGQAITDLSQGDNVVLYAIWTPIKYTISFNPGTGQGVMDSIEATFDTPVTLPQNQFTKEGFNFNGWQGANQQTYQNGALVTNLTTTNGTTVELTAQWIEKDQFTIEFNPNPGNGETPVNPTTPYTQKGYVGQDVTLDTVKFSRTGYTFKGWSDTPNGDAKYADGATTTFAAANASTVKLYAVWEAHTYTVTFVGGDNTTGNTDPQQFTYDVAQALNTNGFNKEGYHFAGWSTTEDGTVDYTDAQQVKNLTADNKVDVKLYAVWEANQYRITFDSNAGNGSSIPQGNVGDITKTYGTPATLPNETYTRDGYQFKGWAKTAEANTAEFQPGATLTDDLTTGTETQTLYAVWEANTYTVTFVKGDGAEGQMNDQTFTYDQAQQLTNNTFTKEGYTFKGWATQAAANTITYENQAEVKNLTPDNKANVKLYAVWEANNYTVTFKPNKGSGSTDVSPVDEYTQNFTYGAGPVDLKANQFIRPGYTFQGWAKDAQSQTADYTNAEPVENLTSTPNGNVDLYAVWKANNYTISFDANGGVGTEMNPIIATFDKGTEIPQPTYTKPGFTFAGWQNPENGAIIQPGTSVTDLTTTPFGQVRLVAQWQENAMYTITYKPNGGEGNDVLQTQPLGTVIEAKDNPFTRYGYKFEGWSKSPDGPASIQPGADITNEFTQSGDLYAIWSPMNEPVVNPDGSITVPGADGLIPAPNDKDNVTVMPNGDKKPEINPEGNVTVPEGGQVILPGNKPVTPPSGSVVTPQGDIITPNGPVIKPDGNVTTGPGGSITVPPVDGNIPEVDEDGNTHVPNNGTVVTPQGPIKVPDGTIVKPDGTIVGPNGEIINPDGSITVPGVDGKPGGGDDVTVKPNGDDKPTVNPDGNVTVPEGGQVILPGDKPVTPPNGSVVTPQGDIITPNGPIIKPDGNVTTGPDHNITIPPVNGNIPEVDEDGNTHVPNGGTVNTPQGPIQVPDGTIVKPDGTIVGPNGEVINPDGSITVPGVDHKPGTDDDVTIKPNDKGEKPTVNPEGNVVVPDGGQVILPGNKPVTPPNGSQVTPEGEIITPGGVIINPDGSVTLPGEDGKLPAPNDKDNITVMPNDGNPQVDENGNVSLPNGGTITPNDPTTGKPGTPTTLPNGSVVAPNGIVTMPEKNDQVTITPNPVVVKPNADGSITLPGKDGTIPSQDDVTVSGNGAQLQPNGNVSLPNGGTVVTPDGTIEAPAGSTVLPDGTVLDPNGNVINPDGSITVPGVDGNIGTNDDVIVKPNDKGDKPTQNENGNINVPDNGTVVLPGNKPVTPPNGSQVTPQGDIITPNGPIIKPDGNVTTGPDHNITVPPVDGNIPQVDEEGNTHVPNGGTVVTPDGPIKVPDGTIVKPDGTIVGPNGEVINPDGSITVPGADHKPGTNDDVTVKPNDNGDKPTVNPDGNVVVPDGGQVILPGNKPVTPPNGSQVTPEGEIITPGGVIINPDGSVTLPGEDGKLPAPNDKDNVTVMPNDGNPQVDENGNVSLPNGGTITPNDPATGKPGTPTTLPNGSVVAPNGIVTMPEQNDQVTIQPNPVVVKPNADGSITLPGKDGTIPSQDDVTVSGNGAQLQPNGNVSLPNGGTVVTPDGTIEAPAGSTVLPDGTVIGPNGEIINPDGSITVPGVDGKPGTNDDVTVKPNDNGDKPTINPDGNVVVPEGGQVILPGDKPVTPPNGSVVTPEGDIITPGGPTIKPDGNVTTGPNGSITVPPVDGNIPQVDENGDTHVPNGGTVVTPSGPIQVPNGTIIKPDGTIVGPNGEIITSDGRGWINAQDTIVHSSQAIADITSIDALIPAMNAQAQYDGKAVTPSVSTADLAKIQAGIVGSYPVTFTLTGPQTRALGPNQASVTRIYTIINDEQQLPTPQPEVKPTPEAKPQTPTGVKVSLVSALVLAIATLSLVVVKRNRK